MATIVYFCLSSDAEEPFYLEEEPEEAQEELNPFELLQAERESEFLGALIEPLSMLPEEYAQYATNDLGDRLRQTVRLLLFIFFFILYICINDSKVCGKCEIYTAKVFNDLSANFLLLFVSFITAGANFPARQGHPGPG